MTIDWWVLGIQTVNVLVLVWLLQRFFWRPVAAVIEQRRTAVQKSQAEAAAQHSAATAALAENERIRAGFAEEREAILAAARAAGERIRAALLEAATTEAAAVREAATAVVEKQRQADADAWVDRASHLAVDIAARLASRLEGRAVRAVFLDWLIGKIGDLPDEVRRGVVGSDTALVVISAAPLDPPEQAQHRNRIGMAFGAPVAIEFKSDPTLIAGLELHGPHLVVSNSWRADLTHILAELTRDQRP